jgi:hypothetical protein
MHASDHDGSVGLQADEARFADVVGDRYAGLSR